MATYQINHTATKINFSTTINIGDLQTLGWEFDFQDGFGFEHGIAEVHIHGEPTNIKTKMLIYSASGIGDDYYSYFKEVNNSPRIIEDLVALISSGNISLEEDYSQDYDGKYVPTFVEQLTN